MPINYKKRDEDYTFYPVLNKLTSRLKSLRNMHGYTAKELGEKLGFAQSYVSTIENGFAQPSVQFLRQVAELYQQDLREMMLAAGLLHPQYATLVANRSEEIHCILRGMAESDDIPNDPPSKSYARGQAKRKK